MIRVAVFGATGYGGAEVIRILSEHPFASVVAATSERLPGTKLTSECPWLVSDLILETTESAVARKPDYDVAFLAVESGKAGPLVTALGDSMRIIDHIVDPTTYEQFYSRPWSEHTTNAVYGLPEITPVSEIASANLIANPGCHPTAAILGLAPLVRAGLTEGVIVVDSKTGVSGGGRASTAFHFAETDAALKPYGTTGHRHTPEIEQIIGPVRFTPHLVPMARGLLTTSHAKLTRPSSVQELRELIEAAYENRPFVRLVDAPPSTKQVAGTNRCDIFVDYDARTQFAVVFAAIDNLGKGMAGQAVQNMNLMFGLPETAGLPLQGVWP